MISVVSAHLCFDERHPRKKQARMEANNLRLEAAQIDGVMMSCRSVWAKRFIEFNHSTLIFFARLWKKLAALPILVCFIIMLSISASFFLSFYRLFCAFHPAMQNNLQNGWISAYLQWVKWRCCIVVVKWFYCLISIHKIAYEIHFVGEGSERRHTPIHAYAEGENEREYNLSFWLLDKHSIFIVILFLYTLTRRSCSWNDPI